MKRAPYFLLPLALAFGTTGNAQQTQEATPPPPPGMPMGPGGGMMGGMDETHMKNMQNEMLEMHDLSNKILAEKDPAKKQALKDQQLELMKQRHARMMSMMGMRHQGGQQ